MKLSAPFHYAWAMLRLQWWKLRGYSVLVDGSEWCRRQEICRRCPSYVPGADECGVCGCPIEAKTPLASEQCPKRFWLAVRRKK